MRHGINVGNEMSNEDDVNIGDQEGQTEFDESTIPEAVLKKIAKEARQGYLPKERYDTAIGNLKDEIGTLSEKVEKKAEPAQAPAKYTRAQLRAAVDNGTISDDQMEQIWGDQVAANAAAAAESATATQSSAAAEQSKIDTALKGYAELVPDLNDETSDSRIAAEEAFKDLVDLHGVPKTQLEKQRLEAMACRTAFGPLNKLKGRIDSLKKNSDNAAQEIGGGDGDSASAKSTPKGVPKSQVKYYQSMIDRGQYKDWAEVQELVKKASPAVKRRMGK